MPISVKFERIDDRFDHWKMIDKIFRYGLNMKTIIPLWIYFSDYD